MCGCGSQAVQPHPLALKSQFLVIKICFTLGQIQLLVSQFLAVLLKFSVTIIYWFQ